MLWKAYLTNYVKYVACLCPFPCKLRTGTRPEGEFVWRGGVFLSPLFAGSKHAWFNGHCNHFPQREDVTAATRLGQPQAEIHELYSGKRSHKTKRSSTVEKYGNLSVYNKGIPAPRMRNTTVCFVSTNCTECLRQTLQINLNCVSSPLELCVLMIHWKGKRGKQDVESMTSTAVHSPRWLTMHGPPDGNTATPAPAAINTDLACHSSASKQSAPNNT